jgi:hypothetical protein
MIVQRLTTACLGFQMPQPNSPTSDPFAIAGIERGSVSESDIKSALHLAKRNDNILRKDGLIDPAKAYLASYDKHVLLKFCPDHPLTREKGKGDIGRREEKVSCLP